MMTVSSSHKKTENRTWKQKWSNEKMMRKVRIFTSGSHLTLSWMKTCTLEPLPSLLAYNMMTEKSGLNISSRSRVRCRNVPHLLLFPTRGTILFHLSLKNKRSNLGEEKNQRERLRMNSQFWKATVAECSTGQTSHCIGKHFTCSNKDDSSLSPFLISEQCTCIIQSQRCF